MKVRHIAPVVAACALLLVDAGRVSSQTLASASVAQTKSQEIAASFSKFKNLSKEKYGIKKAKYLKVESQPVVRSNPEDYSGTYEISEFGFAMHLHVDHSGNVEGDGYEPLPGSRGATRVHYAAGNGELEGVFMNRTSFESPTDKGFTRFGLGALGRPIEVSGLTLDKFFYELKSP